MRSLFPPPASSPLATFAASAALSASGSGELASVLTEPVSAKVGFETSVAVVKTIAEMSKRLLDNTA